MELANQKINVRLKIVKTVSLISLINVKFAKKASQLIMMGNVK